MTWKEVGVIGMVALLAFGLIGFSGWMAEQEHRLDKEIQLKQLEILQDIVDRLEREAGDGHEDSPG